MSLQTIITSTLTDLSNTEREKLQVEGNWPTPCIPFASRGRTVATSKQGVVKYIDYGVNRLTRHSRKSIRRDRVSLAFLKRGRRLESRSPQGYHYRAEGEPPTTFFHGRASKNGFEIQLRGLSYSEVSKRGRLIRGTASRVTREGTHKLYLLDTLRAESMELDHASFTATPFPSVLAKDARLEFKIISLKTAR